jgi:UDP-N-acetylglucosamine--N-acetylmuramyl-(pentapeptide) pyrophosphoryl-undecaprenol N-acetylglucosamine transferase
VYTGNPIRPAVAQRLARAQEKADTDGFHLLVFGGSQGAHHINMAMPEALSHLDAEFLERMTVVHQTGAADLDDVRQAYQDGGHAARVQVVPFIEDMASAYARADLVVCRAGAMTVAELTVCRLPSILVPFPYAIYNHQELNARTLSDRGAAALLLDGEMDGSKLAAEIQTLAGDPDALARMAECAAEIGRPAAGDDVARHCEALAERRNR